MDFDETRYRIIKKTVLNRFFLFNVTKTQVFAPKNGLHIMHGFLTFKNRPPSLLASSALSGRCRILSTLSDYKVERIEAVSCH